MFGVRNIIASIWCVLVAGVGCWAQSKPVVSRSPLSEERIGVYRAFLDRFASLHFRDLANLTIPLDFKGFAEGRPCLRGIDLEGSSEPFRTTHTLGTEITNGRELRLIDPADDRNPSSSKTQYLTLSEIAFDTQHRFAVLKYLLVCGPHCVSGATLVMEKMATKWAVSSRRPCAMFAGR